MCEIGLPDKQALTLALVLGGCCARTLVPGSISQTPRMPAPSLREFFPILFLYAPFTSLALRVKLASIMVLCGIWCMCGDVAIFRLP